MQVDLDHEQRDRLELIAIYSGKTTAQMLVDAAQFLLNRDSEYPDRHPVPYPASTQRFLSDAELQVRFSKILRY